MEPAEFDGCSIGAEAIGEIAPVATPHTRKCDFAKARPIVNEQRRLDELTTRYRIDLQNIDRAVDTSNLRASESRLPVP